MACTNEYDKLLPLEDLQQWVSDSTYEWLTVEDEKEAAFKKELEQQSYMNASSLFVNENEDDDPSELKVSRVQTWASSKTNPDGIGGIFHCNYQHHSDADGSQEAEEDSVEVIYILSESWHGFGDQPWAASRHVANLLADPKRCCELLQPLFDRQQQDDEDRRHPLEGVSFLELGAGSAVPSWTALRLGARVVSTDQTVANRIRCMSECVERNWRAMLATLPADDARLGYAKQARVCPHDWGKSVEETLRALHSDGSEKFNVIVGADCCYMPWFHEELLDSIEALLSEDGVAVLPFALHGNTDDEGVWGIVDTAKARGFHVETLEPQQLTPQKIGMGAKQGLVNTVRLSRLRK